MERLRNWASSLKTNIIIIYFGMKHPDVPLYIKLVPFMTVSLALSPIDPIPDFIPILGYLDDLIFVPLGIFLSLRLLPDAVLEECKIQALERDGDNLPRYNFMKYIIILGWITFAYFLGYLLIK